MRKLLIFSIIVICLIIVQNSVAYAFNWDDYETEQKSNKIEIPEGWEIVQPGEVDCYIIDNENNHSWSYDYSCIPGYAKNYNDKSLKNLNKTVLRANKLYDKSEKYKGYKKEELLLKSIKTYPNMWPAYFDLAEYYYDTNQFNKALKYAIPYYKRTNDKTMYALLGDSYYFTKQDDMAYKIFKEYIKNQENVDYRTYYKIAESGYERIVTFEKLKLGKYTEEDKKYLSEVIYYANKAIENTNDTDLIYKAEEIKYKVYCALKNKKLALHQAEILKNMKEDYGAYMRIALQYDDKNKKLENYYKAKAFSTNEASLYVINRGIANIEQEKIDNAIKNSGIYVKCPNWKNISSISSSLGSTVYWSKRQDEFFKSTNNCIKNYKGQNFVACINQINNDQEKLNAELKDDMYRQQQLARQDELIRQQQLQTMFQAESAFYQSQSAEYQRENAYYQRQNYLQNIRPVNYTVIPTGNTIQIHKF